MAGGHPQQQLEPPHRRAAVHSAGQVPCALLGGRPEEGLAGVPLALIARGHPWSGGPGGPYEPEYVEIAMLLWFTGLILPQLCLMAGTLCGAR